jgi:hypothetical protein
VERLIRFFNSNVRIETIPPEKVNDHNWVTNKKAIEVVEKMTSGIENSSIYKTVSKIIKNKNILKCYKQQMVDDVSARLLFFRVAKDLVTNSVGTCYLIPADNDNSSMLHDSLGEQSLDQFILSLSLRANQIRHLLSKTHTLIIHFVLPTAYIILRVNRMTIKRIQRKSADIAMPVAWGFHEGDVMIEGIKRTQDDGYLYNEKIRPGNIIHIFKHWRFPQEVEAKYRKVMAERGIPYADERDYKISIRLVWIAAKLQIRVIWGLLSNGCYFSDRQGYIWNSNRIIYWMLDKYLEFENINYTVEFIRHDYSPAHVVETILCHQNNKKTVGIQHAATPFDLPKLSYIHFDKYIVYGDMFVNAFSPYWDGINLEKTGRESVDWAVNLLNDTEQRAKLRKKLEELYLPRKHTVVIAMSGDVSYNLEGQWDAMYNALYNLKKFEDLDFNLFLQFRTEESTRSSENMIRFARLPERDERIIVDHKNFSTYELMALCDVFIACNVSFTINEAAAVGAKVFTFNLHGRAHHFFGDRYGKDFILNTTEDLVSVFKGMENDFKGFDCNWELLKRESNFHDDGRNHKRIQDIVRKLVAS